MSVGECLPRARSDPETTALPSAGSLPCSQRTWRSLRHERVCLEEVRRLLNTHLPRNRAHRVVEAFDSLLGLEHVEDAKAVFGLSCRVKHETLERKVGGGFD